MLLALLCVSASARAVSASVVLSLQHANVGERHWGFGLGGDVELYTESWGPSPMVGVWAQGAWGDPAWRSASLGGRLGASVARLGDEPFALDLGSAAMDLGVLWRRAGTPAGELELPGRSRGPRFASTYLGGTVRAVNVVTVRYGFGVASLEHPGVCVWSLGGSLPLLPPSYVEYNLVAAPDEVAAEPPAPAASAPG